MPKTKVTATKGQAQIIESTKKRNIKDISDDTT
jgi:hypothetical protein